ncbi:COX15/CtaA family protein [Henriciella marina]|uniref:Heme A synthase n=1 Tax=Henriciella marina TaxID=453851 RepID=A0ABT4LXD4_9PROT|nr:COX15/CtaA family protein [Henriciella marina]MCZ4299031.1 COX15/CtaA family protein [Henriciella marina]
MTHMAKSPLADKWIRRWLVVIALLVYAMILIGGMTRLTDSGLSITEWDVIGGTLPPLSEHHWAEEFAKYKQTAEFQQQNYNMTFGEFEYIYWWEWGHRLFGRLIGLIAVGGLVFFLMRNWIGRALTARLVILIALGGLQGAIGWWMVSSGIGDTDRLDVAPYRLMTHFMLALIIIGYTVWLWLDLGGERRFKTSRLLSVLSIALLALVSIQMASGALVAGLDAGRTYTDWPLMDGAFLPASYIQEGLGIRSLFEGLAATQFNHRVLAYVLWGAALGGAMLAWGKPAAKPFALLATLVTAQAAWGIYTLVSGAPLELAIIHQALGVIVFIAAVRLVWITRSPQELQSATS